MNFDLVRPCKHCPFRNDIEGYLHGERATEIAHSLVIDRADFPCHKTTEHDDDGEHIITSSEQQCAGAMIMLEKMEHPTGLMEIAEGLGKYDMKKLDMDAPVVADTSEFVRLHGGEEGECCEICDPGCEYPAGFLSSHGGVVHNFVPPGAVEGCIDCGTMTCESCECYCNRDEEEE